jgi:hypothetical protein
MQLQSSLGNRVQPAPGGKGEEDTARGVQDVGSRGLAKVKCLEAV